MDNEPVSLEEMTACMLGLWLGSGSHDPEVCRKLEPGLAAHVAENQAEIAWLVRRRRPQARGKQAFPRLS